MKKKYICLSLSLKQRHEMKSIYSISNSILLGKDFNVLATSDHQSCCLFSKQCYFNE